MSKFKLPKVGDKIYIPAIISYDQGLLDVSGGIAVINNVIISKKLGILHKNGIQVTCEKLIGHVFNYKYLLEIQKELKLKYDNKMARLDDSYDWHSGGY